MEETIFYEQPYDTTSAGGAIEAYLNRFLGIRVSGCVLNLEGDVRVFTDNTPIRHVVMRDNKGQPVSSYYQGGKIFPPTNGWTRGGYSLTYASGYGRLQGTLPAHIDPTFTSVLAGNLPLPQDLGLALRRLQEIFVDREGGRPDLDSQSQEFGNTNWISPVYRATIPTEIRGLLMNHRKVAI